MRWIDQATDYMRRSDPARVLEAVRSMEAQDQVTQRAVRRRVAVSVPLDQAGPTAIDGESERAADAAPQGTGTLERPSDHPPEAQLAQIGRRAVEAASDAAVTGQGEGGVTAKGPRTRPIELKDAVDDDAREEAVLFSVPSLGASHAPPHLDPVVGYRVQAQPLALQQSQRTG